jgi:predicted kinase
MSSGQLLILTGPSHAGKSSTAQAILRSLESPAAHVAIDEIMSWLDLSADDAWETGLPVAYDVAASAVETLLRRGFVVLLESTFTFIPGEDRRGMFHADELRRFIELGRTHGRQVLVTRLTADPSELLRRNAATQRMDRWVIEGTARQHEPPLPVHVPVIELATADLSADEAAARVLEALGGASRRLPQP